MLKSRVVLDAPSRLGLRPLAPGKEPEVRQLPDRPRAYWLPERIGTDHGGRVPPPPYAPAIDPTTGVRNAPAIAIDPDGNTGPIALHTSGPSQSALLQAGAPQPLVQQEGEFNERIAFNKSELTVTNP